jgi:hypothetical protein
MCMSIASVVHNNTAEIKTATAVSRSSESLCDTLERKFKVSFVHQSRYIHIYTVVTKTQSSSSATQGKEG